MTTPQERKRGASESPAPRGGWIVAWTLAGCALFAGCGDPDSPSDPSSGGDTSIGGGGQGGNTSSTGGEGGGGSGAFGGGGSGGVGASTAGGMGGLGGAGGTGGAGGAPYVPADLQGHVYVGHFLGNFELHGLDTTTFDPIPSSPLVVNEPHGDVLAASEAGWVAITLEGTSTIAVYDAETLMPIAGSPYATGNLATALAYDATRDRLFVYCIGTVGVPSQSEVTIYDTSTIPFTEIVGSPFAIDVAANNIAVDPVSGRLFGTSLSTAWAVDFDGNQLDHASNSPFSIPNTGSSLALNPELRHMYFANRKFGQAQELFAFDMDSFTQIANSPLTYGSGSAGDVVADPTTGHIYMVDYFASRLFSATAQPLAMLSTCGGTGCALPPTETGLALDYELGRLFIAHVPDLNNPDDGNGFLSAWDVSNPETPTELTTAGARPPLSVYPNRMSIY